MRAEVKRKSGQFWLDVVVFLSRENDPKQVFRKLRFFQSESWDECDRKLMKFPSLSLLEELITCLVNKIVPDILESVALS